MFEGLRDYLGYLEKNGKLLRVKKEVDTCFEIAAGIRKISNTDGPVLLFENIKGFPDWRVVGGLYATQKLTALALGLPIEADEDRILKHYLAFDQRRLAPKIVYTGPVKEVIIKGKDIDLSKLPVPTYSALDSGPYLLAGVEIGRHPDTGVQNVSIHRREIQGKDRTAIFAGGYHHLDRMILAAEQKGQSLVLLRQMKFEPQYVVAYHLD